MICGSLQSAEGLEREDLNLHWCYFAKEPVLLAEYQELDTRPWLGLIVLPREVQVKLRQLLAKCLEENVK